MVGITRIEFEGPRLAIYCQKPEILQENSHIVGEIAGIIKKRIVIRSDPSVRMNELNAEHIIKDIIEEAGLVQAYFDPALGEVVLEVEKPGVAIGKNGNNVLEIVQKTHWSPNFKRSPPIPSMTIRQIRGFLYSKSKEREKVLRETGESIFRPIYQQSGDVRITFLGSSRQVGRSAILVKTRESEILMDCGINPGSKNAISAYPRLDVEEFDLSRLDAVVISHAHLDHCGFLPYPIQVRVPGTGILQRANGKRNDPPPERLYRCHKQGRQGPTIQPRGYQRGDPSHDPTGIW